MNSRIKAMVDTVINHEKNLPQTDAEQVIKIISSFNKKIKSPTKIEVSITNKCNQQCIHCSNGNLNKADNYLSVNLFKTIMEKEPVLVVITGGEPFLNDNIFEILKYIKKCGSFVKICTNATLCNEDVCRNLSFCGLDETDCIQISLDAAEQATYKKIRGTNQYDTVISNIDLIKRTTSLFVELHFVPNELNYLQAVDTYKLACQLGVNAFSCAPLAYIGNALDLKEIDPIYLLEKECDLIEQSIQQKTIYKGRLFEFSSLLGKVSLPSPNMRPEIYKCSAGTYSLYIDNNSNVFPCVYFQHEDFWLGNLKEESIDTIIKKGKQLFERPIYFKDTKCLDCELLGICFGGCLGISYGNSRQLLPGYDKRCKKNYLFHP